MDDPYRATVVLRHHADDFGAVLALVAAGQGVALVPDLATANAPSHVIFAPLTIRRRTFLAYRRGTQTHPVIAASRQALHTAAHATNLSSHATK